MNEHVVNGLHHSLVHNLLLLLLHSILDHILTHIANSDLSNGYCISPRIEVRFLLKEELLISSGSQLLSVEVTSFGAILDLDGVIAQVILIKEVSELLVASVFDVLELLLIPNVKTHGSNQTHLDS